MIKKDENVRQQTCVDMGITEVIRATLDENHERILTPTRESS